VPDIETHTPAYLLSSHVHACQAGTHVILLDLLQDRYLAFDAVASLPLRRWIADWPVDRCDLKDGGNDGDIRAVIEHMMRKQLIAPRWHVDTSARVRLSGSPSRSILEWPTQGSTPPGPRHIRRFAFAIGTSLAERRLLSMHRLVLRFRKRQQRIDRIGAAVDANELQRLVMGFLRLRPLAFGSKDSCLFHSLAMARYLSCFRVSSRWVFGVQDAPFGAHCWLVHEDILLNDSLEHVAQYTPIMEV